MVENLRKLLISQKPLKCVKFVFFLLECGLGFVEKLLKLIFFINIIRNNGK